MTAFRRLMLHVGCTGGLLLRSMVALLAAVAAGLPVLAILAHGDLVWVIAFEAAGAAALVAYVNAAPTLRARDLQKKISSKYVFSSVYIRTRSCRDIPRQPEFVSAAATPAEDDRSSLREALDALDLSSVRELLDALGTGAGAFAAPLQKNLVGNLKLR